MKAPWHGDRQVHALGLTAAACGLAAAATAFTGRPPPAPQAPAVTSPRTWSPPTRAPQAAQD
ncbi:hypothetical protein, partial [Actinomadura darangshiensis]|uniref:hypothetical protein n=1 Tax=Actinomadura darangshiensis TaxID=705336 RepID=UPI001A9D007C